jgi:hypothetical protein
VSAAHISNSIFHKFRNGKIAASRDYDTVLFDAGWVGPGLYDSTGPYSTQLRNSVVLQDNENNHPLTYDPTLKYDVSWLPDPNSRPYHVVHYDGKTYALLQGGGRRLGNRANKLGGLDHGRVRQGI